MKNSIARAIACVVVLRLISCVPITDQPTPHVPDDTPNCAAACTHLKDLKCPEGEPLEDGTTCQQFCENTQNSGHALNPTCVLAIKLCPEINKC
jgi:hypothetical protein